MRRFKSARKAQRFLSAYAHIGNLFRIRHRYSSASGYREAKSHALTAWREAKLGQKFAALRVKFAPSIYF
jgi:putative transposase